MKPEALACGHKNAWGRVCTNDVGHAGWHAQRKDGLLEAIWADTCRDYRSPEIHYET